MYSLVVLLAVIAAAVAAPNPQLVVSPLAYSTLVQPPNTPAVVLDPHGRPLDTAEVASARALHYQAKALEGHLLKKRSVGHLTYAAAPSAVSHQSRVDVHSSPAIVASAPIYEARSLVAPAVYASPSVYAAPAVYSAPSVYAAGAASHQSRVDVHSEPAYAVSAPAFEARAAPTVYSAGVYAAAPSAVSHQSRVDVRTSPAVFAESPAIIAARSVVPTYYAAPAAVSHQSRFDVRSSPAVVASAPVVAARSVYAPAVRSYAPSVYAGGYAESHQSRVDVETSPALVASAPAVVEARLAPSVHTSYSTPLSYATGW